MTGGHGAAPFPLDLCSTHRAQLETNTSLKVGNKEPEQSGTANSPSQHKREEMLLFQASFIREGFFGWVFFPHCSEFSGVAVLTALERGGFGKCGFWHGIWEM